MSQISRPFQIIVLVVGVLALVWLFVLQGHSSTPNAPTTPAVSASTPSTPSVSVAQSEAKAQAAPTNIYHGAAPGVEGLTRAIAEAHKAVATSQGNASNLEQKSEQASDSTAPASTPSTSSSTQSGAPSNTSSASASVKSAPAKTAPTVPSKHASTQVKTSHPLTSSASHPLKSAGSEKAATKTATSPVTHAVAPKTAVKPTVTKTQTSKLPTTGSSSLAGQKTVEQQLARGNVVVLLFWSAQSPIDVKVHEELQFLFKVHQNSNSLKDDPEVKALVNDFGSDLSGKIAIDEASPSQSAEYGVITHGIQVYSTPTMLIVNKTGKTIVLTGLQDSYAIEQSIEEARNS